MSLYNDEEGRSVLAVNNEYTNLKIMYGGSGSGAPENADDVRKGKAAHGVSVVEIAENDGKWSIVVDSPYNRKFTADAPMEITGPARGHELLRTAADPEGVQSLGTWNNCGNGRTPWGTYLACEENFHSYYSSSDPDIAIGPEFKRYGVGPKGPGLRMGDGGRAIRHRKASERVESQRLHRRDRPSGSRFDAEETDRDGSLQARERGGGRRRQPGRWSPTWVTTSGASSSTSS